MASIDAASVVQAARMPVTVPRVLQIEQEVDTPSQPMALRKTALMQAIDLNDDLSGLVSSMRRSRSREGVDDVRGSAWMEQLLDPEGPQKLDQLRQQLSATTGLSLAALRALIQNAFPDSSDQLVALRLLCADAALEALHEDLGLLEEELLSGSQAGAARSGLNIAMKARRDAPKLRTRPHLLRRSYREFLQSDDIIETYSLWIDQYGHECRSNVVDFIDCALAADMYALDPGCNRLEFGQLLQRLRQLTTLRSADELLLRHCWDATTLGRCGIDTPALTHALLTTVSRGRSLQHLFEGLLSGLTLALDAAGKVRFMQGVRLFLRAIPHGLWPDAISHVQVLDEVEAVLERAVPLERASAGVLYQVVA